ncbi:MAG: EAL domain-containing protein [Cyanobacteria bacterium P01_G01_bin.54]
MDESFITHTLSFNPTQTHQPYVSTPPQGDRVGSSLALPPLRSHAMNASVKSVQLLTLQQQILEMIATDQDLGMILQTILQGIDQTIAAVESVVYPLDPQHHLCEGGISTRVEPPILSNPYTTPWFESLSWVNLFHQAAAGDFAPLETTVWAGDRILKQSGLTHVWGKQLVNSQGQTIGLLMLYSRRSRKLMADEQQFLAVTTHLASIAIEQRQARVATQQAQAKYQDIFEHLSIGIFQTTPAGQYLSVNPALATLYGYDSPAQLITALTDIGDQLYVDANRRAQMIALLQTQGIVTKFESQVRCRDGELIWISENMRAVYDTQGDILYYEGTVEDVTARQIAEARLLHSALHDDLTQLPNRACFLQRVRQAIAAASSYAVLFIDLDRFKVINDSLGHLVGDELLQAVAGRFAASLDSRHLLARLGGDEFALLLSPIEAEADAVAIAKQLLTQLQVPFQLQQYKVFVEASIGIAWGETRYTNAEAILRDADIAMYRAKNSRCQYRYQVFDPQMQVQVHQRLQLEHELRDSLERQELYLAYQPLMDLHTGDLQGFEALLRWQHPERGAIAPSTFIPIAEETGQIHVLGDWILEQACQQLQQWSDHAIQLNVNLSLLQIREKTFLPRLQQLCTAYGVSPAQLKLELTESCLLGDDAVHRSQLQALKAMGFSLCVDDFGTGYSSLSRLHSLPIDSLKIDRAFIENLGTQEHHSIPFIRTMVALAQSLDLELVAEGVETDEQAEILCSLGCSYGQGYFWAKPFDAPTADAWVQLYAASAQ